MKPLVLLSVIIATFAVPVVLMRRPGRPSYAATLKAFTFFIAFYVFLLLFVYPRLS